MKKRYLYGSKDFLWEAKPDVAYLTENKSELFIVVPNSEQRDPDIAFQERRGSSEYTIVHKFNKKEAAELLEKVSEVIK